MLMLMIVKKGYGTLKEVKQMSVVEFMDIVEYEQIISDIENYQIEQSKNVNR